MFVYFTGDIINSIQKETHIYQKKLFYFHSMQNSFVQNCKCSSISCKEDIFLQFVWKILPFRLLHLDNYSHHLLYQTSRSVQKNRRHFLRRSVKHTLICLCCQGKNTLIDVWWFTPLGKNRTISPGPWLNTLPVTVTRSKQKWGWIQGVRVHG